MALIRLRDVRLLRHDRRVVDPGPVGMTFLRPVRPVSRTLYLHRHTATTAVLRPRLRIAVAVIRPAAAAPTLVATPAPQTVVRCRVVERAERLVQRLQAGEDRAAASRAAPAAPQAAAVVARARALQAWGGRVPTVVARRAAPPEVATGGAPRDVAAPFGTGARDGLIPVVPGRGTSAPAHEPEAGVDVRQLTDQVIAAIDRRVVARRERLGRA